MDRRAIGRLKVRAVDLASGREARGFGEVRWTCREGGGAGLERTGSDATGSPGWAAPARPRAAREANEHGTWLSGATRGAAFRGAYRWEPDAGALLVSHLRRGHDRPVRLVRLVPAGPSRLASERPHPCGADRYELEVRLIEGGMRLRWTIHGPRKRIRLALEYGTPVPAPILRMFRSAELRRVYSESGRSRSSHARISRAKRGRISKARARRARTSAGSISRYR